MKENQIYIYGNNNFVVQDTKGRIKQQLSPSDDNLRLIVNDNPSNYKLKSYYKQILEKKIKKTKDMVQQLQIKFNLKDPEMDKDKLLQDISDLNAILKSMTSELNSLSLEIVETDGEDTFPLITDEQSEIIKKIATESKSCYVEGFVMKSLALAKQAYQVYPYDTEVILRLVTALFRIEAKEVIQKIFDQADRLNIKDDNIQVLKAEFQRRFHQDYDKATRLVRICNPGLSNRGFVITLLANLWAYTHNTIRIHDNSIKIHAQYDQDTRITRLRYTHNTIRIHA